MTKKPERYKDQSFQFNTYNKEYKDLDSTEKAALGYVRNNYEKQILNYKGFTTEHTYDEEDGSIREYSDIYVYTHTTPQEQSLMINEIKNDDGRILSAYDKGVERVQESKIRHRRKRVQETCLVVNNKFAKNGEWENMEDDEKEYFENLGKSGELITVKRKRNGEYRNVYSENNDWFETLSNIKGIKNYTQVSLGFGSDERKGFAVDKDTHIYPLDRKTGLPLEDLYTGLDNLRNMIDDSNLHYSIVVINKRKGSCQPIFLFPNEEEIYCESWSSPICAFASTNLIEFQRGLDIKEAYTWSRHLIESCFEEYDPKYVGYMCKNPLYGNNHVSLDSRGRTIDWCNQNPIIEKRSFFDYWLPRLFNYAKKNCVDIPLSVYRLLKKEEEYSKDKLNDFAELSYKVNNSLPMTKEEEERFSNYSASSTYNKTNLIKLTWLGGVENHPYYSHINKFLNQVAELISLTYEEVKNRFLACAYYPVDYLEDLKARKITRNTAAFIDSGLYQVELHKDYLLSLHDVVKGVKVREALMIAYEWFLIGFGDNYTTIEDLSDIHNSAVGGFNSSSDYASYFIQEQEKKYGRSISYYSWSKGIRTASNGSKYTEEQRLYGNATHSFYSNLRRINTKIELNSKKFTEVEGSSRYKTNVKNQNTKELIANVFFYEGNEFLYNLSNRKNNECLRYKLRPLYFTLENIEELANIENLNLDNYRSYILILCNLFEEKSKEETILSNKFDRVFDTYTFFQPSFNYKREIIGNNDIKEWILSDLRKLDISVEDLIQYRVTISTFNRDILFSTKRIA